MPLRATVPTPPWTRPWLSRFPRRKIPSADSRHFGETLAAQAGMTNERVALYARVSTLAGQSPEMQLVELREYAARRGWSIVEEYVDRGVSGVKESRPALNRLMDHARQRRFDVIAVWKIDRFGRSLRHLVNSIAELENLGVSFVSLRDSIDLSSPSGVLMF